MYLYIIKYYCLLILELQRIFSQFDQNGDNKISAGEMQRALKHVAKSGAFKKSPMTKDAMKVIEAADTDGKIIVLHLINS